MNCDYEDRRRRERREAEEFEKNNPRSEHEKTIPHKMCEAECLHLKRLIYRAISIVGQHDEQLKNDMQDAINKK